MNINISRKDLDTILKQDFPEFVQSFESIDDLLDGDLDLKLAVAMGAKIMILEDSIRLDEHPDETMLILMKISNMSDEDHMQAYDKHGFFHDGGDDLDYGCGFVGVLYDILRTYFIKTLRADMISMTLLEEIKFKILRNIKEVCIDNDAPTDLFMIDDPDYGVSFTPIPPKDSNAIMIKEKDLAEKIQDLCVKSILKWGKIYTYICRDNYVVAFEWPTEKQPKEEFIEHLKTVTEVIPTIYYEGWD